MTAESSTQSALKPASGTRAFEPLDYGLYALTVLSWSASWFAISLQVGVVSPEVNLVWRFDGARRLFVDAVRDRRSRVGRARQRARYSACCEVILRCCPWSGAAVPSVFVGSGFVASVFSESTT